jgi:hypothetical protein
MLKSRIRLLITLVLALVATAIFSTLCPASGSPSQNGSTAAADAGSVKPKPIALTGDPDVPQAPPPVHLSGGITSPPAVDGDLGDLTVLVRWISSIWATMYWRTVP